MDETARMILNLSVPSYDWLVDQYQLSILKNQGDFSIDNGNIATTRDGDFKIGGDAYSALHRFVQAWRYHYPHVRTLFELCVSMTREIDRLSGDIDEKSIVLRSIHSVELSSPEELDPLHDAFEKHDAAEFGHNIYSSCVIFVIDATLRRFKDDIGSDDPDWANAIPHYNGISLGQLVVASANSFRHGDEWAKTNPANKQQERSQQILEKALRRGPDDCKIDIFNCSRALEALSSEWDFRKLEENVFSFARNLTIRRAPPARQAP